ncbi:hypothetical protein E2C01_069950 [Portunus trituberculatus]|uniref:Uncharacterized protein n=1 Tax=Portunus trituberculatus TaxID=210409 RepID=A0A5B7HSY0_PORTR|nr:hypothetical protein [Portunus trituberculatus]
MGRGWAGGSGLWW